MQLGVKYSRLLRFYAAPMVTKKVLDYLVLKIKESRSPETSLTNYQTTLRHNPGDFNLHVKIIWRRNGKCLLITTNSEMSEKMLNNRKIAGTA